MLSDGCSSPTHQELLHIINEETDRLNTMLTEAIQMSRIEAGQVQLRRSPQSMSSLVRAQLERLAEVRQGHAASVRPSGRRVGRQGGHRYCADGLGGTEAGRAALSLLRARPARYAG